MGGWGAVAPAAVLSLLCVLVWTTGGGEAASLCSRRGTPVPVLDLLNGSLRTVGRVSGRLQTREDVTPLLRWGQKWLPVDVDKKTGWVSSSHVQPCRERDSVSFLQQDYYGYPFWDQCNNKWRDTRLGRHGTSTLCRGGSVSSVLAMGFRAHNVKLCRTRECRLCIQIEDPATFVAFMSLNNGYDHYNNFIWNSIPDMSENRVRLELNDQGVEIGSKESPVSREQIIDWLQRGAVIVARTNHHLKNYHGTSRLESCKLCYMLVTGVEDEFVIVNDPTSRLGEGYPLKQKYINSYTVYRIEPGACIFGNTDIDYERVVAPDGGASGGPVGKIESTRRVGSDADARVWSDKLRGPLGLSGGDGYSTRFGYDSQTGDVRTGGLVDGDTRTGGPLAGVAQYLWGDRNPWYGSRQSVLTSEGQTGPVNGWCQPNGCCPCGPQGTELYSKCCPCVVPYTRFCPGSWGGGDFY